MMEQRVDVICQHTYDGRVIPLKVRLRDEDGEFQTFSIKAYKVLSCPGEYVLPNEIQVNSQLWRFECKVTVFQSEKRILLVYNTRQNSWVLPMLSDTPA